ncbi:MAG: hypothetical protein V9G04_03170 [Nocardioides sp.]
MLDSAEGSPRSARPPLWRSPARCSSRPRRTPRVRTNTTFASGGRVTLGGGGNRPVALDHGNSDMVITVSVRDNATSNALNLRVFNADGTANTGFAGNGQRYFGNSGAWRMPATAVDKTTGNIYVSAWNPDNNTSRIWRFTPWGAWDQTWGKGGGASFNQAQLTDIAMAPNGQLVVADRSSVYRMTPEGKVDSSFGAAGGTATPLAVVDHLSVQGDGKILAAGRGAQSLDVVRLLGNGTVDSGFGNQGRATIDVAPPLGAWAINGMTPASAAQTNTGSIVLAGGVREKSGNNTRSAMVVTRFTPSGALDTSYATHRDYNFTLNGMLAKTGDDKILLPSISGNKTAVVRLLSTGAFDTSWGFNGTFADANPGTRATGLIVQWGGRVVATGVDAQESGLLYGLVGDAVPKCAGRYATAYGDGADNVLQGTLWTDVIVGRGGHDTITGRGGADYLCGNGGKDKILGGSGADTIKGGSGADTLKGGSGKDRLWGGSGADKIFGGSGKDKIVGGPGKDKIKGGPGKDQIKK